MNTTRESGALRVGVRHPLTFLLAAGGVYAAAVGVASVLPGSDRAGVVAVALTVDLAVVVPGLYWWLLVRGRGWPRFSVVPVFLVSLAGAAWVLPAEHRGALGVLEWLAVPAELFLVGFLVRRAVGVKRRVAAAGEGDVFDRLRAAARQVVEVPAVAEVLAYEVGILYYALFSWRSEPHADGAAKVFTHHRRVAHGAMTAGLVIVVLAEVIPVHLLIALWSPTAAWLLTALSLYAVLWLVGDDRAVRLRPTLLRDGTLEIRVGMRWNLRLPLTGIHAVRPAPASPLPGSTPGYLNASVFGSPNVLLELTEQITARGPYGWRKEVTVLGLTVDDVDAFMQLAAPQP